MSGDQDINSAVPHDSAQMRIAFSDLTIALTTTDDSHLNCAVFRDGEKTIWRLTNGDGNTGPTLSAILRTIHLELPDVGLPDLAVDWFEYWSYEDDKFVLALRLQGTQCTAFVVRNKFADSVGTLLLLDFDTSALSLGKTPLPLLGEALKGVSVERCQLVVSPEPISRPFDSYDLPEPPNHPVRFAVPEQQTCSAFLQVTVFGITTSLPLSTERGTIPSGLRRVHLASADPLPRDNAANNDLFTKWFDVDKTFGPAHLQRIGLAYRQGALLVLIDGDLQFAGLRLSLLGLHVGATLAWPPRLIAPGLDGANLFYSNPNIEISAGLLRGHDEDQYSGAGVIRIGNLAISAIGSYRSGAKRSPSLFVYAVASYPLGGPPYFFVTGFAGGFGYNRGLNVPDIDAVSEFPLVAAAMSPTPGADLGDSLETMEGLFPPEEGRYWLAAGVKFSTFAFLRSFALLTVSFGNSVEVTLLGLSVLELPPGGQGTTDPLARVQLALQARFVPATGLLSTAGALTSESYILDRECRLTGGFALNAWFDGQHQGDFAIVLGGYHPAFDVPTHYPQVDRLGFHWSKPRYHITIRGESYFALTPSCIMAGGMLAALYDGGVLKAWFALHADFLLAWHPLHYEISMGVAIGASYTMDLGLVRKTFSVELSAGLSIWGPDLSGTVYVDWEIISFTVSFGASTPEGPPPPLTWQGFVETLLSEAPRSKNRRDEQRGVAPLCTASPTHGLIREIREQGKPPVWVVDPKTFGFSTRSAIPCTTVLINDRPLEHATAPSVGIPAMNCQRIRRSSHNISVRLRANGETTHVGAEHIAACLQLDNLSKAAWSPDAVYGSRPGGDVLSQVERTIPDVPVGASVSFKEDQGTVPSIPCSLAELTQPDPSLVGTKWPREEPCINTQPEPQHPWEDLKRTILDAGVVKTREAVLAKLTAHPQLGALWPGEKIALPSFAIDARPIFAASPRFASLGSSSARPGGT